jgi:hypothetical protein
MQNIMSRIYKSAIAVSTITGTIGGLYYGKKMATTTCFIKKDLTQFEYAGEVFCYSGITLSFGMVGGVLSGLCTATAPLSAPLIYYVLQDKTIDTER